MRDENGKNIHEATKVDTEGPVDFALTLAGKDKNKSLKLSYFYISWYSQRY